MRKFECKKQDCPYKRCYVEVDDSMMVICMQGWTSKPEWHELPEKANESLPEPELDDWRRRRKEHYEECRKELFEKLSECGKLADEMWGVADEENRSWMARSIKESIQGMRCLQYLKEKE